MRPLLLNLPAAIILFCVSFANGQDRCNPQAQCESTLSQATSLYSDIVKREPSDQPGNLRGQITTASAMLTGFSAIARQPTIRAQIQKLPEVKTQLRADIEAAKKAGLKKTADTLTDQLQKLNSLESGIKDTLKALTVHRLEASMLRNPALANGYLNDLRQINDLTDMNQIVRLGQVEDALDNSLHELIRNPTRYNSTRSLGNTSSLLRGRDTLLARRDTLPAVRQYFSRRQGDLNWVHQRLADDLPQSLQVLLTGSDKIDMQQQLRSVQQTLKDAREQKSVAGVSASDKMLMEQRIQSLEKAETFVKESLAAKPKIAEDLADAYDLFRYEQIANSVAARASQTRLQLSQLKPAKWAGLFAVAGLFFIVPPPTFAQESPCATYNSNYAAFFERIRTNGPMPSLVKDLCTCLQTNPAQVSGIEDFLVSRISDYATSKHNRAPLSGLRCAEAAPGAATSGVKPAIAPATGEK